MGGVWISVTSSSLPFCSPTKIHQKMCGGFVGLVISSRGSTMINQPTTLSMAKYQYPVQSGLHLFPYCLASMPQGWLCWEKLMCLFPVGGFNLSPWTHLANGPWNRSLNVIFPTKNVIPKSLKFSHWPSKLNIQMWVPVVKVEIFFNFSPESFQTKPPKIRRTAT